MNKKVLLNSISLFIRKRTFFGHFLYDKMLPVLSLAITISALLVGLKTFNAKASVEILPTEEPTKIEYRSDKWSRYYSKLGVDPPTLIKYYIKKYPSFEMENWDVTPHDLGDFDIERLELIIDNAKHKAGALYRRESQFLGPKSFGLIWKNIKEKIDRRDSATFLKIAMATRVIRSSFWIKNTGKVDLRNIRVKLMSPFNMILRTRKNNMKVDIDSHSTTVRVTKKDSVSFVLNIRRLSRKDKILLRVKTRNTELETNEADIMSFEPVAEIDKASLVKNSIYIFLILLFFFWLLYRRSQGI